MTGDDEPNGYQPARGSYEEGCKLLGVRSPVNFGPLPVETCRIAAYCALIEDANPSYWDQELSVRQWGRPVAPPGMLQTWTLPAPWTPAGATKPDFMLMNVPLPGSSLINVSTEIVYHRPIYVGETLNFWDVATEISDEKETRLGIGHFVTTVAHFQNATGEPVATVTNVQFRFEPKADS
jgi:acyl dehydratase